MKQVSVMSRKPHTAWIRAARIAGRLMMGMVGPSVIIVTLGGGWLISGGLDEQSFLLSVTLGIPPIVLAIIAWWFPGLGSAIAVGVSVPVVLFWLGAAVVTHEIYAYVNAFLSMVFLTGSVLLYLSAGSGQQRLSGS